MDFDKPDMLRRLEAMTDADMDRLDFGLIKLDPEGRVCAYNDYESRAAGLGRDRVLGLHFFTQVGPCMNNALVAGRMAAGQETDVEIDYVFTHRLKPEAVRLRLLSSGHARHRYILVRR